MVKLGAYIADLQANNRSSHVARQLSQILQRLSGEADSCSESIDLVNKFREVTTKLDALRDESTFDVLPELGSLLK